MMPLHCSATQVSSVGLTQARSLRLELMKQIHQILIHVLVSLALSTSSTSIAWGQSDSSGSNVDSQTRITVKGKAVSAKRHKELLQMPKSTQATARMIIPDRLRPDPAPSAKDRLWWRRHMAEMRKADEQGTE